MIQVSPEKEKESHAPSTNTPPPELEDGTQNVACGTPEVEKKVSAWLCVLGAFLYLMPSFGFMQTTGSIQAFLLENQLRGYSARDVGWITGVYSFLTFMLGIQTGPLVDVFGPAPLGPIAAVCLISMFFLLAECKEYWQFMLCLGVLGGIGNAISTTVGIAVVGKLFHRHRGLALGIALAGSSTGGIVFPLALRQMFPAYGWIWSMRIIGFITLGIMVIGLACLSPFPRLMAKMHGNGHESIHSKSAAMDFSAFRSTAFSLVTFAQGSLEFVIFGATAILPTLVTWAGFPPEAGYNMLAILNGLSSLGRVLPGIIGDHLGHFNVLLTMIILTVVCTAATITAFGSTRLEALYAFAALGGFGTGSFLSLAPVCMGKTCDSKNYGRYYGTMNFVISFALLITMPIGGQMLESLGARALSGLYVGIVLAGGILIYLARAVLLGRYFDFTSKI